MRTRPLIAIAAFLFVLLGFRFEALSSLANTFDAQVVKSSVLVKRDTSLSGGRSIVLQAFRNGHDGLQLVLTGNGAGIKNIRWYLKDDFAGEQGSIARSNLTFFREIYLHVTTPTGMHPELYPEGEFPDPLLPLTGNEHDSARAGGLLVELGRVGAVGKSYLAMGDGGCFSGGLFTGDKSANYVVEIDGAGELGEATFKWSDRWDGKFGSVPYKNYASEPQVERWNAERIRTTEKEIALNNGVTVRFTGGKQEIDNQRRNYSNQSRSNFHAGDRYYFKAYQKFNEVIYGDLSIPAQTAAGHYKTTLIVTADNQPTIEIPLELQVYDILVPKERSISTAFGRAINPSVYHRGSPSEMLAVTKHYEEVLHSHRLDYEMFNVSPLFEFDGDQLTSTDWRAFDAVAGPRLDGTYWRDGVPMKNFTFDFGWLHPGIAGKSEKRIKQIALETARHLRAKGWFDKAYVYCLDEAVEQLFPMIREQIGWIEETDPGWRGKFMITANPTQGNVLLDKINIWCPPTYKFDEWSDYGKAAGNYFTRQDYAEKVLAKGNTFWLYVANYPTSGPYMSYQLDRLSLHEPRLLKWASWYEGATGFLYWATIGSNAAIPNVYLNPWYTEGYGRDGKANGVNGDGFLIYPGDRNGIPGWKYVTGHGVPFKPITAPLPSLRLKQIRDGLEDWEMFLLAEKMGLKEQTRREVGRVYTQLGGAREEYDRGRAFWSRDDKLMWDTRDKVARMLEKALAPR